MKGLSTVDYSGKYDFTKDANAQWFLKRVVELT